MGVELVTKVNDIPKGSRLAVSTNLLASIISVLMRATGQTAALDGPLERDRAAAGGLARDPGRVAGRLGRRLAGLGRHLAGNQGHPRRTGARAATPSSAISRGCLLPAHRVLGAERRCIPEITERLTRSLVLIHGGMAQNVGPILEMVTEKYLLRERHGVAGAAASCAAIFDEILAALKDGDVRALAGCTTRNWDGPLKTIIPWVTNALHRDDHRAGRASGWARISGAS